DVDEESQTRADLLEDLLRDLAVARLEPAFLALEPSRPVQGFAHGQRGHVDDVLAEDRDRQRLRLEPAALADRAGPLAHVFLDVRPNELGRRVAVLPLQPRDDALPLVLVGAPLTAAVLVREPQRLLRPEIGRAHV